MIILGESWGPTRQLREDRDELMRDNATLRARIAELETEANQIEWAACPDCAGSGQYWTANGLVRCTECHGTGGIGRRVAGLGGES